MVFQRGPKYVENNNNYNIIMLRIFKRSTDAFLWPYICSSLTDWTGQWRGWLRHSETSRKVVGSIPDEARSQYDLGFDSSSNRNEYQGYFQRDNVVGGYGRQPYQLHVSIVWKCGNLSLLEPLKPVQVSTGIDLPVLQVGEKI